MIYILDIYIYINIFYFFRTAASRQYNNKINNTNSNRRKVPNFNSGKLISNAHWVGETNSLRILSEQAPTTCRMTPVRRRRPTMRPTQSPLCRPGHATWPSITRANWSTIAMPAMRPSSVWVISRITKLTIVSKWMKYDKIEIYL